MKFRMAVVLAGCVLAMFANTLSAQGVYVIQGEKGPVFSDKPQPGAKPVTLRPLSVIPAPKETVPVEPAASANRAPDAAPVQLPAKVPMAGGGKDETGAPLYNNLVILAPEEGSGVIANTGVFEVRLAVDPPLRLGEGHAFIVRINGRTVAQRFTATEFLIPPEFWGDTLPPPNQPAQLDVNVVDGGGQVLKRAASVRFFMRYATIMNRPHPIVPIPPVQLNPGPAKPKPKPKPESEPVVGKVESGFRKGQ